MRIGAAQIPVTNNVQENYKNIIEASGFENVKALLLYVPEMELVEVN